MGRPSFIGVSLLFLLPIFAFPSAFGWHFGSFDRFDPNSVDNRRLYVLKKSESPQWEDLGWAWGKRSLPNSEKSAQSSANWDDLGWAWGKRSSAGGGGEAAIRREKAHVTDPILSVVANRVVRSMSKQSPDWHDLGWAWGRRK
ncbi:hypothetical protein niasHS_010956 [Heterodera schachtii]|uniref:Uncharacterized protein n=1 Tax=Heterodera schachtii TaxID=97005 RepID=A0ABD2IT29_HETSC